MWPTSCSICFGHTRGVCRVASKFARPSRRNSLAWEERNVGIARQSQRWVGDGSSVMKTVFEKHRDALEHHETMMGVSRGRLAVALDLLTDSLALVGQHGVYCRSERFPGKPKLDVALVLEQLDDAKQLVQSAMEELRNDRDHRPIQNS